ncbi:MAG: MFS transporter [Cytophagales bacterium]
MTKERLLLLALAAVQFTNIMDFMIMMPLGPQLMRTFSINPQEFSILVSSYTFSAGIFGFVGAFFIDKFDRKTAIMIVFTGFTIGTLMCGLSDSYVLLLAARILTGVFGGLLGALVLSIIGDAIPLERRATAMGTVMAAFSLASVLGVPFGLYLATTFTWQMPFLLLAGLGVVVLFLIYQFVPSMTLHLQKLKSTTDNPFTFVLSITKNPNQLMALGLMVFMMLSQFSYISMLSPFMVSNVGFTEHDLTYVYLLGGAVTIFTSPLAGKLADRYGRAKIFTIGSILMMGPTLYLTSIGQTPLAIVLVVTSLNFIFIGGRMIPGSTMVTAAVLPQNRGSFMSINSSIQQLSSGLGAFLAGMIVYKNPVSGELVNYNYVGYFAIAATIISIVLANKVKAVDSFASVNKPVSDHV